MKVKITANFNADLDAREQARVAEKVIREISGLAGGKDVNDAGRLIIMERSLGHHVDFFETDLGKASELQRAAALILAEIDKA